MKKATLGVNFDPGNQREHNDRDRVTVEFNLAEKLAKELAKDTIEKDEQYNKSTGAAFCGYMPISVLLLHGFIRCFSGVKQVQWSRSSAIRIMQ